MKYLKPFVGALALTATLTVARAENLPPGQVDFGTFSPPSGGGEFVEVNITGSLISMVSRFVEKEDAEIAKVLNGLHLIRVNVIGLDDANRPEIAKRAQKVRKDLDSKGWERIVTAQKQDQDVTVYLKTQNKDTVQGLAVVVMDGAKQAVFVNIVGDIKPEQLAMVADKFHVEPLKRIAEETRAH